jgi:hypothetical protein
MKTLRNVKNVILLANGAKFQAIIARHAILVEFMIKLLTPVHAKMDFIPKFLRIMIHSASNVS